VVINYHLFHNKLTILKYPLTRFTGKRNPIHNTDTETDQKSKTAAETEQEKH